MIIKIKFIEDPVVQQTFHQQYILNLAMYTVCSCCGQDTLRHTINIPIAKETTLKALVKVFADSIKALELLSEKNEEEEANDS